MPLYKHVTSSIHPINDADTTNMQIRTLTLGLEGYSVKCQVMNTQDQCWERYFKKVISYSY